VRNHERVVAKSELIHALWPGTFVEDANLTQHIYTLRKVLGDQPTGKPYIETSARRGYRLAAHVREVTSDAPVDAPSSGSAVPGTQRAPPDATPIILEAERKQATVLHCAVSNAAAAVERLGAAGLHDLMRRVLELASIEIERYEGVVSERHAEGFVAVFGAPVVHEDDGRRAILAALAIQCRFRELTVARASGDEPLDLQFGINSGSLIVSRVLDNRQVEYAAVGETMRTASLLQQFAGPGDILITETTRRAVERYVVLESVPAPVSAALAVYRVIGVSRQAPMTRTARTLTRFVGRQQEITLLERLCEHALAGFGQVVGVAAEPGMGKSRLMYEFTRALATRGTPPSVVEGRCLSYGSLIPYLPLTELVRAECGLDESDLPAAVSSAIRQVVAEGRVPPDAGVWLLRLLGVVDQTTTLEEFSPEAVKARTFDALRLLLFKAAARHPLVIIVEDVHWIDRTSEEFLAMFVERLVGTPVMIVATYRPGYTAPWMHHSHATQITLSPLTARDSTRLVESVAGDRPLDAEVSHVILSRGEGNPFFLEELARTVFEHGSGTDSIPQTVHGVIMARIDRLPEISKQLLQTAAVLGREVSLRLLRRVWRGPANAEADPLELCRQEFLYERSTGDEPTYVFKHALTQDVAYDSLLARTRRELHARAAHALEDLYADRADEVAATLAYHYARTDLVSEAVDCLTRAADRAARVYANAEAMLHLELAARRAQRLPEGPDRDRRMLEIALRQAQSLYLLGRFQESVDVLRPHEARLVRLNDMAMTGAYSFWLAHMYSRLGDQRRATDNAHRAIEAATTAGDEVTVGKAHGLLGLEAHWAGNPQEGIARGAMSVRLLESRVDQRWWLGMAHFYLAMNHLLAGEFEVALGETGRAESVGRAMGDPRLRTYAGYTTGWIKASRGHLDAAIAACRCSLELAPDRVSRAYASMFLGYALLESGAHEEARVPLELALAELEGFGFPQWYALALVFMADVCRLQGRLDEAAGLVEQGLGVATRAEYGYALAFAQRTAGRVARDRAHTDEARRMFELARTTFDRISAAFESARTRLDLAELAHRTESPRRARRELAAAVRAFHALGEEAYCERAAKVAAALGLRGIEGM
jgi:class 3 adenylate cyclase/tetratricopeptide (TPR) repeat protein